MDHYILSYLVRWYVTTNKKDVVSELELWDYLNQVAPSTRRQDMTEVLHELKDSGFIQQFVKDIKTSSVVIYFNKEQWGRAA